MTSAAKQPKSEKLFRGDRLLFIREQMGLSQEAMGQFLGFGTGVISRYENGISDPLPAQLVEMSKRLEVSVDWLLGLTDDPEPNPRGRPAKKEFEKAEPKNIREAAFLDAYRSGELLKLIKELAQELIVEGHKDSPNHMTK